MKTSKRPILSGEPNHTCSTSDVKQGKMTPEFITVLDPTAETIYKYNQYSLSDVFTYSPASTSNY